MANDFESRLSASSCYSESLVKGVDSKFRKSAQEVHIRYSKVCSWDETMGGVCGISTLFKALWL